jgi:hypothetical protein
MIPDMASNLDNDFETIEMRNTLRAEAGLPMLDIPTEVERLNAAREEADFELEFARRLPDFCHWMTNMGRWSRARPASSG